MAQLLTIRWPSYWPLKWPKCGPVTDLTAHIYISYLSFSLSLSLSRSSCPSLSVFVFLFTSPCVTVSRSLCARSLSLSISLYLSLSLCVCVSLSLSLYHPPSLALYPLCFSASFSLSTYLSGSVSLSTYLSHTLVFCPVSTYIYIYISLSLPSYLLSPTHHLSLHLCHSHSLSLTHTRLSSISPSRVCHITLCELIRPLVCIWGTESVLAWTMSEDGDGNEDYVNFKFMTVKNWGARAHIVTLKGAIGERISAGVHSREQCLEVGKCNARSVSPCSTVILYNITCNS